MRNLLPYYIIVAIGFSLQPAFLSAQTGENWWKREFTIGLNLDPPQRTSKPGWNSSVLWDSVSSAGFNLSVGLQYKHGVRTDTVHPATRAANSNVRYLYHDGNFMKKSVASSLVEISKQFSANSGFSGVHVKDEPTQANSDTVLALIRALHDSFSDKLFFVNLFPTYYFPKDSFNNYKEYVHTFLSDTTLFQVVCFDNYFPNNCFTDFPASDSVKRYYSNISLLRRMSGNRPLWSYVLTTEKRLTEKNIDWQQAFIRLSAFAPLAYGCNGLIYYTFDTRDGGYLLRDFSYSVENTKAWEEPLYFCAQDNEAELFIGRFCNNDTGRYDIAIKSDSLKGSWWVKFAEATAESTPSETWDHTFTDFGLRNNTEAFIGDWDDDGLDEFIALVRNDGRLLVSRTLGAWQHSIVLSDFFDVKSESIDRSNLAVGHFDSGILSDFCIAWPNNDTCYNVRIYLNYQPFTGTFASYTDMKCNCLLHLYTSPSGNLYAFTDKKVYAFDKASGTWDNGTGLHIKGGEKPDHFWIESDDYNHDRFFIQTKDGKMYSSGQLDLYNLNQSYSSYSAADLSLYTLKNYKTGNYDVYGVQRNRNYGSPALLDYNHNTTERFAMVKEINCYIRENLAPIVLNSRWIGTWHSTIPPGEIDSLVDVIDSSAPILKGMDGSLVAGLFEQSDTAFYLLVVNRQETTTPICRILLRGNRTRHVAMLPRINGANSTLTATFRPDSMDTELIWENMTGGECVALRVTPPHSHKCKDDFDGDGISELLSTYSLSNNNVCQRIFFSFSNYADTITYTFPFTPQRVPAYTASADFDGDGRGDISLLDGASGKWWFRMSHNEYALASVNINTDSVAMPFVGDYNGDGCADLCYRKDKKELLFVRLSDNGIFTEDSIIYVGYGTSHSTRSICGDYDGNGSDDIALYRSDNKRQLMIDYTMPYNPGLCLGQWNCIYAIDTIDVCSDVREICVTAGDFDGDGLCDLCVANLPSNTMYIDFGYNGFSSWEVSAPIPVQLLYTPCEVRSGDYDGDGLDDICYVYKREYPAFSMQFCIDLAYNGFHGKDMWIP